MKRGLAIGALAVLATTYVVAQGQRQGASAPIMIQKQGSFAAGGTILGDADTRSLHCDHGYVDYQIPVNPRRIRSEEHTSELQSPCNLVCRLLLEKKKMICMATCRRVKFRYKSKHRS